MNFITVLIGAYLALSSQNPPTFQANTHDWQSFKLEHGKSYDSQAMERMREIIFSYNKQRIDAFNLGQIDEEHSDWFALKLNHLADLSDIELKTMNGFKLPADHRGSVSSVSNHSLLFLLRILADKSIEVPDELDWRQVPGRVSEVKNQGQCGSCWAFSSTGALEGQERVRNMSSKYSVARRSGGGAGQIVELSEQNLVDCVSTDYGCQGGYMKDAFEFIKTEGGIDDEQSYPYEAVTRKCRFNKRKVAFTDSGAAILPEGDEQKLKEVVAKFGPVSVAIDASSMWFQFYHKGVYYNKHCRNKKEQLDHAVLVVGYGTDPKKGDYWLVKNSWGPKWGDHGYIKMARNRQNNCGIATIATIPTF